MTTTDAATARAASNDSTTGTPTGLVLRYSPGEGVTLDGCRRGDGVYDTLAALRLNWRGFRDGTGRLYVRGSRDRDIAHCRSTIERSRAALEAGGWVVSVDVTDDFRPAAQRRADADNRATERADMLHQRAARAAGEADAAREARRQIADGIPLGQPKLIGHHSYARACRDEERMDALDQRSYEAADKADRAAAKARGVEGNAAHRSDPRAIMRRIEKLEADRRGYARQLAGYTREFKNGRGEVYYREEHPAATGQRAEDLRRWDARDAEEVTHLRGVLAELAAASEFSAWGPDDFQRGDFANVGGQWCEVARVNRKSVSVRNRWEWSTAADKPEPVTWDKINGRRRGELQWDAPHAEPWPVRLARTVARWRRLERSAELAHQHRSGSDEWWSDVRVGYARRIVHDLPTDASAQELAAVLDSLPDTAEAQRERAAAYMTVWDRLAAGEKLTDVAASVTPEPGAPAWRLPTDRDPVDRAARDLEPGDLVAGVYNTTFGGRRLVPSLVGPVAHVSDVRDRRESGTWLTVTLSSGDTAEMKSWQLVAVFPHAGAGGSQPVANLPPWRVLHQTADGRLAYVVHEGPTDGHPNGRVIRGEGGIRVEYVAPDGTQTGVFGWERPENLTARTEES